MAFYRSRSDRVLGGVCGGIARALGWRPTVVRILYVFFSIVSAAFPGTFVYIILWIAVPEEPRP
jgi:phage shock protein PspC (stress-responsive transcriptional regulator)